MCFIPKKGHSINGNTVPFSRPRYAAAQKSRCFSLTLRAAGAYTLLGGGFRGIPYLVLCVVIDRDCIGDFNTGWESSYTIIGGISMCFIRQT